ncbi:DUF2235 domain-containing protein [Afipia felis]|uniref:Uncharacterized conserved protein n=2 Tax=Afipia felis TaxID=1035 RepID=A0A380W5L7_AFIFE|nr:DUF2235 domain-containing protein [Afipia felis]EKS31068.1 hypothetical protein HMPREF9697_03596 [Afipia felis ATCC 53690]SUU75812.1 Uncharacterized conserved protein [Afipia felis]SUU83879.1 Uncharacterized conserved protein [Afipia felis]
MPKNILIFSDGTGQAGGLRPDENRSNIYKLYRATRCGPDTGINPREQLAFYDAGLGSQPPDSTLFVTRAYRWLHNVVSQATGLGITTNIIDCYAAIIRMWEPGDRIFLFGFSRGAYTVRCLAAMLGQCGIPTTMADGSPLRRDIGTTTRVAREAVKNVYQHVSSPKDTVYLPQREALATRFRQRYGSDTGSAANAAPFFIGVFDTVASLGSYTLSAALVAGAAGFIAILSYMQSFFFFPFLPTVLWATVAAAITAAGGYVATHLKYAHDLPGYSFYETLHIASPKMKFYDLHLNNAVWYARHAMSIDENRADFARVPWGGSHSKGPERPDEYPDWLQQVWFAGNHSDVGGSYPENEARLSDISLGWMVHAAKNLPDGNTLDGFGIKIDDSYLRLNPDSLGPQHDEREPGYVGGRFKWNEGLREIQNEAILHSTVLERFAANGGVQHYYKRMPYRPENLRSHVKVKGYYVSPLERADERS